MNAKEIADLMGALRQARRHIAQLRSLIDRANQTAKARAADLRTVEGALEKMTAEKAAAVIFANAREREAEEATNDLERRRAQRDAASSRREYDSLQMQIELDEKKCDRLADDALAALEVVDQLDAQVDALRVQIADAKEAASLAQDAAVKQTEESNSRIAEVEARVAALEDSMPLALHVAYNQVTAIFGADDAIAALDDDDYCGACHQGQPVDVAFKTRAGTPTTCASCGRLLYAER